jgi:hypothetical protein
MQWKEGPFLPPPGTCKVFLGLVNFYWRFLPGVDVTLLLLIDALKGNLSAAKKLSSTAEMEASFIAAKAALSRATWLGHRVRLSNLLCM